MLVSRTLVLKVINALSLEDNPEFKFDEKSKDFSIRGFLSSLIKRVSKDPDKGIHKEEDAEKSGLIDRYLRRLKIEPIKGSGLVYISFTGVHPKEIKKIINRHASEYINTNLEVRFAASNEAVAWLQKQILIKKDLVEEAENALQIYKENKKIVSLEDKQNIIVQKLADLNSRLTDARTERMKLDILHNLKKKYEGKQGLLETIPGIMENLLISQLKNEHIGLFTEIKKLSHKYGKNHPAMIRAVTKAEELKTKIDEEVNNIAENIEAKYKVALSQEESLNKALEEQKTVALQLNRDAIAYNTLKRGSEGERAMYEILLKRLKEADITSELQTSNIRIVDNAETPRTPIKPRKKRNVLIGAILGLFIGIGLVFFLEYLDNTIKSPEDVEQYLGIPLLGVLAKIREQVGSSEIIAKDLPKSVFAEAVRSVRTSVMFSMIDKPKKLIMITSAVQGEGKTFIASNLAYAIAQTGKETLLVDTDLRKPRLNEVFNVTRKPGFSNHLIGECNLKSIVKATSVPNLSIITCGIIPPNPSELLDSTAMEKFCEEVRANFDIVIFDTPPAMSVTDAVVLSRNVDGVIITIKSGSTVKNTIKRCISQIKSSKCEILGAVINSADIAKSGYYYHYYAHYYKYGYSSEKELQEAEKV
jgi:capsular exopolysaccharide synthesis family protein